MTAILNHAIDLAAGSAPAVSPDDIGRSFHAALLPYGLKATYVRAYDLWADNPEAHAYARISPPGWEEIYARERLDKGNMLMRGCRTRVNAFAWSAVAPTTAAEARMWSVLQDHGFKDGLAVPCHGPRGYVGLVSLAFDRLADLEPGDRTAIELAAVIVHHRLRALRPPRRESEGVPLTPRERDCLGFVAQGKSDWEISVILSLSQSTVHTHVENAKRKLGARTRAQAVARFIVDEPD
jgi:DNA-binding CsgD family transcriptional regulator